MSAIPSRDQLRQMIATGPGSNIAVTVDGSADAALRPRTLPGAPEVVGARITTAIHTLPRWSVLASADGVIWATRRTRIFRWTDDVFVLLTADGQATRVEVRSASRVGKSDLGQNRRNLAELWQAIDALDRPASGR